MAMCFGFGLAILLTLPISLVAANDDGVGLGFMYNGFRSANLSLDGIARFTKNGLLKLTNETRQQKGHAFYPHLVSFKNTTNGSVSSFSTTFVFAIIPVGGHGIAFVISPTTSLPGALPTEFLGLFNESNNGNETNHVVAVELDTIQTREFDDINDNHVGIDINGLKSTNSSPAGYYEDGSHQPRNLSLIGGKRMQVWIEYDGLENRMDVTLAPFKVSKPKTPLLSSVIDLSSILNDEMYVGFSSSTGSVASSHYVLGWSFKMNGKAEELTLSQLPKVPRFGPKKRSRLLTIGLPWVLVSMISAAVAGVVYFEKRKRKFAEVVEDWEHEYGPHRFKFKDLYIATKGFKDKELLGTGGFGRVYKGVLPTSKLEVAVKRVSHESRQGMKEFVAEIASIGRLRHRNLVQLLGYCRRKGELLLVYDYMPNRSLDKYLYYNQPNLSLNWIQRFRVIKGVASGLCYLHEEWEQVVIHRDVKASNVLLDGEFNGRLGDFGLARLYDHGTEPQTTHIVGTLGYLAPEHTRTGKATPSTDVFAFGAFLLEVACGRRPISQSPTEDVILVDWVYSCWFKGDVLEAKDPNLGTDYVAEEVELVLKLGLLCSHSEPEARPSMRHVVQFLHGDIPLPEIPSSLSLCSGGLTFAHHEGFDEFGMSYTSSFYKEGFSHSSSTTASASLLSGGR